MQNQRDPSFPMIVYNRSNAAFLFSVNALMMPFSLMFYNHPILFSHPNVFVYLQRLPLERTETSSISRGGESGRHYSNQCLNIGQILMHNHTPRTNIENIHVEQTLHTNKKPKQAQVKNFLTFFLHRNDIESIVAEFFWSTDHLGDSRCREH